MSIEANKALVVKFWEAFSAGRMNEVLDLLTDDATWWVGGSTLLSGTYTKPAFAKLVEGVAGMAPKGIRVSPKLLTAEGDRVSVEAESYAEISNGRTYQNIYHFMMVVRDGKFSAIREYLDTEHVTATFGP